jgi:hypothetical protein|tara:strand:- start:153 stop:560 length:408 start_codon:yes stop_codon:yes gene_type:complete
MSQGNAAAIRRRVKNAENLPTKQPTNTNKNTYTPEPQSNLSVNDAFKMVNERLVNLEKGLNNTSNSVQSDIIQEYDNRFNLVAQEIGELKETVLKLQTFTMDVNKTLYDERIKILGDLDKPKESVFNIESLENKD